MHLRRACFVVVLLIGMVVSGGQQAIALDFATKRINDEFVLIGASGVITAGDSDRLTAVLAGLPPHEVHVLVLNSPGGSVIASESLAATIKQAHLGVYVADGSVCASACFVLYAAGIKRFYTRGALIGVHSAIDGSHETPNSMALTTVMARSAAEMGVPDAIVGRMIRTPPGAVAWLSIPELASMGGIELNGNASSGTPPSLQDNTPPASATLTPPEPQRSARVAADPASSSFRDGLVQRTAWEIWFASLNGDYQAGAEYWTAERSKRHPGSCDIGVISFQGGCREARRLLAEPDKRRKTDPQYWWGWNSYRAQTAAATPPG